MRACAVPLVALGDRWKSVSADLGVEREVSGEVDDLGASWRMGSQEGKLFLMRVWALQYLWP